jgi:two-component system, NtrC family, sensor kinase
MVDAPAAARLLVVNANRALCRAIEGHLKGKRPRHRLWEASSRKAFFDGLRQYQPNLIVAGENGVPGLPLREILQTAGKPGAALPVVVLGARQRERVATRLLEEGASDYLRPNELDRLPSIIGRSLREERARAVQLRLQHDIHRAANVMQENQRLLTIGRLAGSIAHEINNPLESVMNLLFLMNATAGLAPDQREYLTRAQAELSRAVEISKQTLTFYREAPFPVPVNVSALLEDVLGLFARKISEKNLQVVREFRSAQTILVLPGEIRQVFCNLIGNAIDANIGGGKLCLRVRRSRAWRDSGVVGLRVIIADSGSGMTAEVRRRIGEPFFTTKGETGTGLGLWISLSIIHRYGGHVALRSTTGRNHGTVFSVFLPTNLRTLGVPSLSEFAKHLAPFPREG